MLESLLFVAGRPLEYVELRRLLLVEDRRLRDAIAALDADCERNGRGLRVLRTADAVQFVSAPENARFVAALLGLPTQAKLTTAALETLAVVAYRQPITRSQIEFIRGVNSDRALASLLQYGLVSKLAAPPLLGAPRSSAPPRSSSSSSASAASMRSPARDERRRGRRRLPHGRRATHS